MEDDDLLQTLQEWAQQRLILPHGFDCRHYSECSRSHGNLQAGESVCMAYVGPRYWKPVEDLEVRLAIVGIDHGYGAWGYRDRRSLILRGYQKERHPFNPHYRGVVKTAAAVFGRHTECAECAKTSRCQHQQRSNTLCVLEMFAQPNLVKCANASDMRSRSTPVMKTNCSRLLAEELEILRPTLLVFHDSKAEGFFKPALTARGWRHERVAEDRTGVLHEIAGPAFRTTVAYLPHPARGHLDRKWASMVEPALASLRAARKIPP